MDFGVSTVDKAMNQFSASTKAGTITTSLCHFCKDFSGFCYDFKFHQAFLSIFTVTSGDIAKFNRMNFP